MEKIFLYVNNQLISEKAYYYLSSINSSTQIYIGVCVENNARNKEEITREYGKFTELDRIYITSDKKILLKAIEQIFPDRVIVVGTKLTVDERTYMLNILGKEILLDDLPDATVIKKNYVDINAGQDISKLIEKKEIFRIIEASNALTVDVLNNLKIKDGSRSKEFDGFWSSSLCDSLSHGKPDMEILSTYERISNIREMKRLTDKPIFYDIDSGGRTEQFVHSINELCRAGVSAVIVEDKIGKKVNSLVCQNSMQEQDTIANFTNKIKQGKLSVNNNKFWIIARIESLILGETKDLALLRAEKYIAAGADAILIHYNKNNVSSLIDYIESYVKNFREIPLAVIPTMYSYVSEKELMELGCKMVIYANHMTRSSIWAMQNVAQEILRNGRALEASMNCIPVEYLMEMEKMKR